MQKAKFRRPSSAPEARKERSSQSYSASHIKWEQSARFTAQHLSALVYFCGARCSCRFAGIPFKIVILICILAIWLAFWFGGAISYFCGTTTLWRVMQHNKPLMFGMYFQVSGTLVRSFLGVAGKSSCTKIITYLYKVVCFFSYKETFIQYSEIFYFAALNKLVYLME